ncbi:hypothetical protein FOCC_FOCC002126 [Frankliniella occidentalis]|nr:hypothetical protein FOCC_FOCC002126 [Frankliniella occidentalis]
MQAQPKGLHLPRVEFILLTWKENAAGRRGDRAARPVPCSSKIWLASLSYFRLLPLPGGDCQNKIRFGRDRPTDRPSTSERPGRLKYRVRGFFRTLSPNVVVPMSSGFSGTSLGTSRTRR